jgi:hypothetical protein
MTWYGRDLASDPLRRIVFWHLAGTVGCLALGYVWLVFAFFGVPSYWASRPVGGIIFGTAFLLAARCSRFAIGLAACLVTGLCLVAWFSISFCG